VGIVLGTGLGKLSSQIEVDVAIPFKEIPFFPHSTALSHAGRMVCGKLAGVPVMAMEGRCHLYEGYRWAEITLPICVMGKLGAELLVVSNASGGVNPQLIPGEIIVVVDHIDLMRTRDFSVRLCLGSKTEHQVLDCAGAPHHRFTSVYDERLADNALEVARRDQFQARRGVYLGLTGPNYETRAEYRFLRRIGADVVGMSTIPEVTAAAMLGMRVLTLSVVTNVAKPDALEETSGEDVVKIAATAEPRLRAIVLDALSRGL
jgi:purine-nucleoside phosphorylase